MANCRISLIDDYPFDLARETNTMPLTYTCFADSRSASHLEIATHGFRYLSVANRRKMVLIIVDERLEEREEAQLKVPLTVLRCFNGQQSQYVKVHRQPIALLSPLLPNLPASKQINVYFHSSFSQDPAIIAFLSSCDFLCQTGEYFIDCKWLAPFLGRFRSLRGKLEWQRAISEQQTGTHRTYLRIYLELSEKTGEAMLFRRGESRLQVKQCQLHPHNLWRQIVLHPLQKSIFSQQQYSDAFKQLAGDVIKKQLIILHTETDIGISSFLHFSTQGNLQVNFKCIDCQTLSSTKEFWTELHALTRLGDSLALVKNLSWVEELYQAEQILGITLKEIAGKLEKQFSQMCLQSLHKCCLVVESVGEESVGQFLRKMRQVNLILPKPKKLHIFRKIFNHYAQKDHTLSEMIPQQFHDKFGWEIFHTFMKDQWKKIEDLSQSQIFKRLRGLSKQEQAENLMEVSWDDVGGLENAKEEIVQTVLLPIKHPEIFDERIRPRTGLLFYGPPGTGKTLLGKCVAKECRMNFISVKGPQLLNMYVGQSEKNVRGVFERARACSPCIVFMDQLDALVPKRGNSGDSNQVMDRIVAELLQQMDTAAANQVFIIGATNRPDLLDPSILRPGRFDKQIYLGITQNIEDRIKIIKAQTRHLTLAEGLQWDRVLQKVPKNFTGADFYGLTSKAVMAAAQRTIQEYQMGVQREKICLTEEDFLAAVEAVKPSVTQADLARYQQLRKIYS